MGKKLTPLEQKKALQKVSGDYGLEGISVWVNKTRKTVEPSSECPDQIELIEASQLIERIQDESVKKALELRFNSPSLIIPGLKTHFWYYSVAQSDLIDDLFFKAGDWKSSGDRSILDQPDPSQQAQTEIDKAFANLKKSETSISVDVESDVQRRIQIEREDRFTATVSSGCWGWFCRHVEEISDRDYYSLDYDVLQEELIYKKDIRQPKGRLTLECKYKKDKK